jgi:hypothetical protein
VISAYKAAWKEAARVFVLSRLLIIAVTITCMLVLPGLIPGYLQNASKDIYHIIPSPTMNQLFFAWLHWDEKPYLNISYFGYRLLADTAFFPLWPLLRHAAGLLLGGKFPVSFYLGGILLANLLFYFALALLYALVASAFDSFIARRTLLYLTFSPYAMFFFAGYSESLFLLLCIAMFVFLQRDKRFDWLFAGLCGMLATLTRSTGLLLAVPYTVVYLQRTWFSVDSKTQSFARKLLPFVPIALIPVGLLIYMSYLSITKGNPLQFNVEEGAIWFRHFTFPLITFVITFQAFFQENSLANAVFLQLGNLENLTAVIIALVILAAGWKRLPLSYSLFTLAIMLFDLSVPMYDPNIEPLTSQPRFIVILFPLAIICAMWSKHLGRHRFFMTLSIIWFILNTALFVSNVWVA